MLFGLETNWYLLWWLLPCVIVFVVQFLCCRFVRRKALRHAALVICAIPFVLAACAFMSDPGFWIGMNVLAAMTWATVGAACLTGYGLALLVNFVLIRVKR